MVSKKRPVDGVPMSLCDLGYCDVGLDDNWQECADHCGSKHWSPEEPDAKTKCYAGDAAALLEFGFD